MQLASIQEILEQKLAVALYFSAPTCNVCHALKPKLFDALKKSFCELEIISVDISKEQETAAYFNVFSIPTLLVFLQGREFLRKSRHMSVDEVVSAIARPYAIMFS